jgi:major type 1 subunit fimbrin (pilin)
MKKNLIALAVLATSAFGAASAFAADGQVNFTGEITDTTCKVANAPATPLTVNLGKVARTAFVAAGDTSSATKFTLELKDCPTGLTTVNVKFDGTSVSGKPGILALTTGGATGVGIQLADDTGTVLPLYTASKDYPLTLGVGTSTKMDFVARYIATSLPVAPGVANAVADFSINYN